MLQEGPPGRRGRRSEGPGRLDQHRGPSLGSASLDHRVQQGTPDSLIAVGRPHEWSGVGEVHVVQLRQHHLTLSDDFAIDAGGIRRDLPGGVVTAQRDRGCLQRPVRRMGSLVDIGLASSIPIGGDRLVVESVDLGDLDVHR